MESLKNKTLDGELRKSNKNAQIDCPPLPQSNQVEERISNLEDKVKENVRSKKPRHRTFKYLGHHEKTKPTNSRSKGQSRDLDHRHR